MASTRCERSAPAASETAEYPHQVHAIVQATLHETPPGATHWSRRSMAKAAGASRSTVQRISEAHGLQPHRVETFKLSTDPAFPAAEFSQQFGSCWNLFHHVRAIFEVVGYIALAIFSFESIKKVAGVPFLLGSCPKPHQG